MIKLIITLIWAICFLFLGADYGYNNESPAINHVTYMFAHANLIHLFSNIFAFIMAFNLISRFKTEKETIIISFISAVIGSFLFVSDKTTVGASGFVYALLANPIAIVLSGRNKINNNKMFFRYIITLMIALIIPFFIKNVNATLHVSSLLISLTIQTIYYKIKQS